MGGTTSPQNNYQEQLNLLGGGAPATNCLRTSRRSARAEGTLPSLPDKGAPRNKNMRLE